MVGHVLPSIADCVFAIPVDWVVSKGHEAKKLASAS